MSNFAIQAGVAIAVSYIGGLLQKKPSDSPVQDFKPTPTVERGSPTPLLIGRELVAASMLWAGNRTSETEEGEGGKGFGGGGGPGQKIWYEEGWHAICVGPVRRLWKIEANGKVIFNGPIDPNSHPSGTTIDLGDEGEFQIYWGEQDQPANTDLGDAERIGITSRWPFICYVWWSNKRLGTNPVWPRMRYEVDTVPYDSRLCGSPAYFSPSRTATGDPHDIGDTMDGVVGTNYVEVDGKQFDGTLDFKPGRYARIASNTISDGDYLIESVEKQSGSVRRIFLAKTISGLTDDVGTVQPVIENPDDGVNPAHAIDQILFAGAPHGMALDRGLFDVASLEEVGRIACTENLRTTLLANDFKSVASIVSDLLQDLGVLLPQDPVTGLYRFVAIRETADFAVLTDDEIVGALPEVETIQLDEQQRDRKLFTYRDRNRNYSEMQVGIDDDGSAGFLELFGVEKISMPTVRDFTTAEVVAKRRDQETYSNQDRVRVKADRNARDIMPGHRFTIPDIDQPYLCLEVEQPDTDSAEVELTGVPDYYGIPAADSTTLADGGGILGSVPDTDEDPAVIPIELPHVLNAEGKVVAGLARIRRSAAVPNAAVYLSPDGTTYFKLGNEGGLHTGGGLDEALLATGPSLLDEGPVINALGPDIANVLDLSAAGQEENWRRGKQIAVVGSGTAQEIWFVRWLESLGGGQYRLREVLRHRAGTTKQAFAADTPVVILDRDDVQLFENLVLAPETTVFWKSLPQGNNPLGLDEVTAQEHDLYGFGVRPVPITAFRAGDSGGPTSFSYFLDEDVELAWAYRSPPAKPYDGAGLTPAGVAVLSDPGVDGFIRLELMDQNSTVLRTVDLTGGEKNYTWTKAQYVSDLGLSPGYSFDTPLKARIFVVKGSQTSEPVTIDIENLGGTIT